MIYDTLPLNYNAAGVISYGAVFTFINTTRNYGKTWGFKRRAVVRGYKLPRRTLWLRRFEDEAQMAAQTFFTNPALQKFCGVSLWHPKDNPDGNVKQIGRRFYIRRGKRWFLFLTIACLSDVSKLRGADDELLDTIVFDEYTTTMAKYRQYRGDEVTDMLDIFISMKRRHAVRVFFLGNKESVINPYFNYFKIKPLPSKFNGIRTYKGGSIAVEQIDIEIKCDSTPYNSKVDKLFKNTPYGAYLFKGEYKSASKFAQGTAPSDALLYAQFNIRGAPLRIRYKGDIYYIDGKVDTSLIVYSDVPCGDYKRNRILNKRLHRNAFRVLELAFVDGRIYYDTSATYENMQALYCWLGATK